MLREDSNSNTRMTTLEEKEVEGEVLAHCPECTSRIQKLVVFHGSAGQIFNEITKIDNAYYIQDLPPFPPFSTWLKYCSREKRY